MFYGLTNQPNQLQAGWVSAKFPVSVTFSEKWGLLPVDMSCNEKATPDNSQWAEVSLREFLVNKNREYERVDR